MHTKLGPKRTQRTANRQENEELQQLYANFQKQLAPFHYDRCCGRTLASWDPVEQAVHVKRKDGKFGKFGYNRNGNLYLESFEAMFLLELRRLQLEYNGMGLSIEQAYLLLLGETSSPRYNEYLVYSHLTRAGYILIQHQNIPHYDYLETTDEDCAWALALSSINNRAVPEPVKRSPFFNKVKKDFKLIKDIIMRQHNGDQLADKLEVPQISFQCKIISNKRKINEESGEHGDVMEAKRRCSEATNMRKSIVDFLKNETGYKRFADIFAKFDIIDLNVGSQREKNSVRTLQIKYDVYLHHDGFKKSTLKPPKFRLIILGNNESFPLHAEILQCYELQKYLVPLLVVSVGESKQMQSFLYYFS